MHTIRFLIRFRLSEKVETAGRCECKNCSAERKWHTVQMSKRITRRKVAWGFVNFSTFRLSGKAALKFPENCYRLLKEAYF